MFYVESGSLVHCRESRVNRNLLLVGLLLLCTPLQAEYRLLPLSERAVEISLDTPYSPAQPQLKVDLQRAGQALTLSRLSYSRKVQTHTDPWHSVPVVRHRWVAQLAEALQPGQRYRVQLQRGSQLPVLHSFVFSGDEVNGSIQINQVGYPPESSKTLFVGNWTGESGLLVNATRFEVRQQPQDSTLFEGVLELPVLDEKWSGNWVYRGDFSALTQPGRYQIRVPGVGRSAIFEIGNDLYAPIVAASFRVFLHHRNADLADVRGLQPGYARTNGAIPQALNGVFHPAVATSVFSRGEQPGEYRAISGGWFDAGDFGQYVTNAALVWYWFSAAIDLAPSLLKRDDLGIPESNNGVADLLDELSWGFAWALSMQDRDGGVYNRIASETWDDQLPEKTLRPRFIYQKTTHATASFAALAAIHARLLNADRPDEARTALGAAERAWRFIESSPRWPAEGEHYTNPRGTRAGTYSDSSSLDNQLWAATELYRATGKSQYRDYVISHSEQIRYDPSANPGFAHLDMAAAWSWLMASHKQGEPPEDAVSAAMRRRMIAGGEWRLARADENPYDAILHHHAPWLGWGSFARSSAHTLNLLQNYRLTARPEYLDWARRSVDVQLGANPLSISFLTGFGHQYPHHPLSKLQQLLQQPEPIYGMAVHGPHAELPESLLAHKQINQAYFPATKGAEAKVYPPMRRYVDTALSPQMSEPTVAEHAATFAAFAVLNELVKGR